MCFFYYIHFLSLFSVKWVWFFLYEKSSIVDEERYADAGGTDTENHSESHEGINSQQEEGENSGDNSK